MKIVAWWGGKNYLPGATLATLTIDSTPDEQDNRRTCMQCGRLRGRKCGARKFYEPALDVLKRCADYRPRVGADDARTAAQLWGGIDAPIKSR